MLPVRDVAASIAFYEQLGFSVERRNDQWRWAMLRCGDARLMLDESINGHPYAPRQGVLYLYPEDVTRFHAEASARGLDLPAIDSSFYGMAEFRMEDLDGNRLWIGQAQS